MVPFIPLVTSVKPCKADEVVGRYVEREFDFSSCPPQTCIPETVSPMYETIVELVITPIKTLFEKGSLFIVNALVILHLYHPPPSSEIEDVIPAPVDAIVPVDKLNTAVFEIGLLLVSSIVKFIKS